MSGNGDLEDILPVKFLESFGHIEVEQRLVVDRVLAQVQADIHAGLYLDAETYAIVGQHAFYLARGGAHEADAAPYDKSQMVDDALQPALFVRVEHLAVFGHHQVRRLVAVLPHVIAAQIKGGARQGILGQRDLLAKDVLALCRPGKDFAVAYQFILAVVQLQPVEIPVASENLVIHHAPEVQVDAPVGIGGHVAAVVGQEETQARVEVLVAMGVSSGGYVRGFLGQVFARLGEVVVVDVNLGSGEEVASSEAEEKPRVDLHAAIPVLAGRVAPDVVLVGGIAYAIEVLNRILVAELAEDAETVALEE